MKFIKFRFKKTSVTHIHYLVLLSLLFSSVLLLSLKAAYAGLEQDTIVTTTSTTAHTHLAPTQETHDQSLTTTLASILDPVIQNNLKEKEKEEVIQALVQIAQSINATRPSKNSSSTLNAPSTSNPQAVINTINPPEKTEPKNEPMPADISFLIADIKYSKNKLKILEFGEGTRSRFSGYDALHGRGKIWSLFWKYLKQFNIPIWYVDPTLKTKTAQDEISFHEFRAMGGRYASSLKRLRKTPFFKSRKKKTYDPKDIRTYKGIIMIRHRAAHSAFVKKFMHKHPGFLFLNTAAAPHVNNKYRTSILFKDEELWPYRPQCKVYPKKYHEHLAQNIIRDFKCSTYVIKPLNAFKGNGIIMTKKKRLDNYLKNIIEKTQAIRYSRDPSLSYWARDKNSKFIIEECEASKSVFVKNKTYDATMRMVFALHYNHDKIHVTFLDGYWKLPEKAREERGTLIQKIKSKIVPGKQSSAKITEIDKQNVKKILQDLLPKLYVKMLSHKETRNSKQTAPVTHLTSLFKK